jgi:sRNA-binding carbon storage regulator CsrA
MLVLSRKDGECIRGETAAGEKFKLHFTKKSNGDVSIAIDAPKTIKFIRDELPPIVEPEVAEVKPEPVRAA